MEIGLDMWKPEDNDYFLDLGAKWTKTPVTCPAGDTDNGDVALVKAAANAGLSVIVDLRPSQEVHHRLLGLVAARDTEATDECIRHMSEEAADVVRVADGAAVAYEFWGEFDCPYVGGFYKTDAVYVRYLPRIYEAIKSVDPNAEVWNGGYGVNLQPEFMHAIAEHAAECFDRANWHHYNITHYWPMGPDGEPAFDTPLEECVQYTADKYRYMFTATRERMASFGAEQPYVSSEWGMPTVMDEAVEGLKAYGLHNFVFQDGIYGLGDTEAAAYLDAWLAVFEEQGFTHLIYHRLRDNEAKGMDHDGTFWGVYCGLLYANYTPKAAMYETVKRWIQKGAQP